MTNDETVKILEGFEENLRHGIPPCGESVQITLNRTDAEKLKELLGYILKQLK